jgi:hypothetical protein
VFDTAGEESASPGNPLVYMNSSGLEQASRKEALTKTSVNLLDARSIQWLE